MFVETEVDSDVDDSAAWCARWRVMVAQMRTGLTAPIYSPTTPTCPNLDRRLAPDYQTDAARSARAVDADEARKKVNAAVAWRRLKPRHANEEEAEKRRLASREYTARYRAKAKAAAP